MSYGVSPVFSSRPAALLLAIALDALLGEPPTSLHPVGWLGRLVRAVERRAPEEAASRRRFGIVGALAFPMLAAASWLPFAWMLRRRRIASVIAEAVVLDTTFALRTLLARADEVRVALERDDLVEARRLLRYHLVSRAVDDLTASEVAGAAIESVAENLSDGVVAPWLAYASTGVPGALAYRAVNTLDAIWGYRTPPYTDLGWAGARLDDLANWVPARVTALAIIGASALVDADARGAAEAWRRDGGSTESPNAGQPMAAMAGALGVVLAKRGAYALGAGREPEATDVARSITVARTAAGLVAGVLVTSMLARAVGECRR